MNPDFVIKDSVLKQYKGAGGDVVIPDGVTELDFESFRFCEGLKTVTIPQSVTAISQGVFSNCTNLTSATVPGSVKTIGFAAFRFCESLTSVVISDGVEELGGNMPETLPTPEKSIKELEKEELQKIGNN